MINGEGKLPPRIPTPSQAYTPRDLDPAKLRKMNHSEWLQEFSEKLALNTRVEMTAFRAGTITRLHWAAEYVRMLEAELRACEARMAERSKDDELTEGSSR